MKRIFYILISLLMISSGINAKGFRFEYQKMIDITGPIQLSLENPSGGIIITGAPSEKVSIEAAKNIRAVDAEEAEEISALIEIDVKQNKNKIDIQTIYHRSEKRSRSFWDKLFGTGGDSFGSVDYTIAVPARCQLTIKTASGNIEVSGIKDKIFINGASGDIILRNIDGSSDIKSSSGEIKIEDIRGDINIAATSGGIILNSITGTMDIRTTSGDTKGSSLAGAVTLSQTSGKIDLTGLSGDVKIKSTSGDISIEQQSGAADIVSYSGRVMIKTELDSKRDYFAETMSGSIEFLVPQTSSGTVKMETGSGELKADLPLAIRTFSRNRLIGDFGSEGPKISLSTSSGDITIGQY
jgi:DUF4097 and DUF4098 domain-containing protein YvlB